MNNYMIRATAADGKIRAFAADTKDVVEEARQRHNLSPIASAALGRLMTATLMMGWDMKSQDDRITLQIQCDGPIKGLLATADNCGNVKGYVNNPDVMLPPNAAGKLDVGGALDLGVLSVIRDTGLKEPYVGQTILVTGEIAEDIAYYYATSEQVPSSVALGVLMNRDNTVRQAGGFIIQLMPGADDELAEKLENRIKGLKSMTSMLDEGMTPEDILKLILDGFGLEINDRADVRFYCNCDKDRVEKVLISVGRKNLEEMIDEGKPAELVCHFCGRKYEFSIDEMKEMLEKAK
ncbi:MAG: Hsp33 family molecular chaperone HslO [Lachnospiraceae bacterium]|nr:Hsp33 family molecular chaperone HslO [Candidatus Darwinimomas equi]